MVSGILLRVARLLFRYRATSWIIVRLVTARRSVLPLVVFLASLPAKWRPYVIKGVQKVLVEPEQWHPLAAASCRLWQKTGKHGYLDVVALAMVGAQQFRELDELLRGVDAQTVAGSPVLRSAQVLARVEVADFPGTIEAGRVAVERDVESARSGSDALYSAYAAGQLLDFQTARTFFAIHYELAEPSRDSADSAGDMIAARAVEKLTKLAPGRLEGETKLGVFFLSATQALGHAILDPYHFIALNRDRYDRLLLVGPPLYWYYEANAACIRMITDNGIEYVETEDPFLINLSWMSMGVLSTGDVDLIIQNYWSLLRDATLRSRDPDDPFRHNAWHFSVPASFERVGEEFARRHGIDLSRPIVTLHAREISYHRINKQSYRDTDISTYEPAVHELLENGYQVLRLGDKAIRPLDIDHADYRELPFEDGYRPELDSFFIARSDFMIGCQSGPCAFARVLGRPLLSVNAVYHYSLLPTPQEMAAFKHYRERDDHGRLRDLSFDEIIERKLYLRDSSIQFGRLGIELAPLSTEEVLEAVSDMIAWVRNPQLPMTPPQALFAENVEKGAIEIRKSPELPVADYVGFSLPGYRIAPHLAARQGPENALLGDDAEVVISRLSSN